MQLKQFKSIRHALSAATCAVLTPHAQALSLDNLAQDLKDASWDFDSAALVYNEKDRVQIFEAAAAINADMGDDNTFGMTLAIDTMTGASPNGASTTDVDQVFTSPSGKTSYTVKAGELPTNAFNDTRFAGGLKLGRALSRLVRHNMALNLSAETDYTSLGISDTFTFDTDNKLTTYSVGAGITFDFVNPGGGKPTGGSQIPSSAAASSGGDDEGELSLFEGERKNLIDVLFGITKILSKKALVQLNYSITKSLGYLTDPYKMVSIINPTTGATNRILFENRPEDRLSQSIFTKFIYHLPEDIVHLSYRYFSDSWDVRSQTVDLNYYYQLGGGVYLQPHLRMYNQTAASFYYHSIPDQTTMPEFMSADGRLADMNSSTVGLKLGMPYQLFERDGEFSIKFEQMTQTGDPYPANAIGLQQNYNLYPDLDVTMVQVGLSFKY